MGLLNLSVRHQENYNYTVQVVSQWYFIMLKIVHLDQPNIYVTERVCQIEKLRKFRLSKCTNNSQKIAHQDQRQDTKSDYKW